MEQIESTEFVVDFVTTASAVMVLHRIYGKAL